MRGSPERDWFEESEAAVTRSVVRCWHTSTRGLIVRRGGAEQSNSEPREDASSERSKTREVTRTTSSRGGAVCLPVSIIPRTCPANGVELGLAGLLFSKVKLLKSYKTLVGRSAAPGAKEERIVALNGIWPIRVVPNNLRRICDYGR